MKACFLTLFISLLISFQSKSFGQCAWETHLAPLSVDRMILGTDEYLYFVGYDGGIKEHLLLQYDGEEWTTYDTAIGYWGPELIDSRGRFWFDDYTRLLFFKNGVFSELKYNGASLRMEYNNIFEDSKQNLWIDDENLGLIKFDYNLDPLSITNPMKIKTLYEDDHGNIWADRYDGPDLWNMSLHLYKYTSGGFVDQTYLPGDLDSDAVEETRFFGNAYYIRIDSGVYMCENNSCILIDNSNYLPDNEVEDLFEIPGYGIVIETSDGITVRSGNEWKTYLFGTDIVGTSFYKAKMDELGRVWFICNLGSEEYANVLDGNEIVSFSTGSYDFSDVSVLGDKTYIIKKNSLVEIHGKDTLVTKHGFWDGNIDNNETIWFWEGDELLSRNTGLEKIALEATNITDIQKIGEATGSFQVEAGGGVEPYRYALDKASFTAENSFRNLQAGTYTAYIQDVKSCVDSIDIELLEPFVEGITDSLDNGWDERYLQKDLKNEQSAIEFIGENSGWISTTNGVIYTRDGGQSWYDPSESYGSGESIGISFLSESLGYEIRKYKSYIYELRKTTNGAHSWNLLLELDMIPKDLSFISSDFGWICGSSGEILHYQGQGKWKNQESKTTSSLEKIQFLDASFGWAAGENGAFILTQDGGENWLKIDFPSSADINDFQFIDRNTGFAIDAENLYKSMDGGLSWKREEHSSSSLDVIYFLDENTGWIVRNIWMSGEAQLGFTDDGGRTWKTISVVDEMINDIWFSGNNRGWLIGDDSKVFPTRTWGETCEINFQDTMYISNEQEEIVLFPGNGYSSYLWSDGSDESYYIVEGDEITNGEYYYWVSIESEYGCQETDSILVIVDKASDASKGGDGMLSLDDTRNNTLPLRVYPNPARETVYIGYDAPADIPVLTIIDMKGRSLLSKTLDAPLTQIDVSHLASGMYFVVTSAAGETLKTKLIIE